MTVAALDEPSREVLLGVNEQFTGLTTARSRVKNMHPLSDGCSGADCYGWPQVGTVGPAIFVGGFAMKTMTKFVCLLMAFVFAAFALPSVAASPPKLYTLQFVLLPFDNGGNYDANGNLFEPMAATVTVRNDAPPGTASSNISSFTFRFKGLRSQIRSSFLHCRSLAHLELTAR